MRQPIICIGLKKNVEEVMKRGIVMKYVVHGEVVGGPSLPKQQWRDAKTLLWKTGNKDKHGVEASFEKGHGYFHASYMLQHQSTLGSALRSASPGVLHKHFGPGFLHGQRMRPSLSYQLGSRCADTNLLA